MAENTDKMAAAMAEKLASNTNYQPKECFCCGKSYKSPAEARFSLLTTNNLTRRICGDCIDYLWRGRAWANQSENPNRHGRGRSWWLWPRR